MRINGLKVIDPRTAQVITVTPRDAKNGASKNPSSCAAALACVRDVPGCTQARVHLGRTYLFVGDKVLRYKTPRPLRTEIVSFDRGAIFQPGKFRLEPLAPSDRATGRQQGTKTGQSDKKKFAKKRVYHTVTGVRQHGANR